MDDKKLKNKLKKFIKIEQDQMSIYKSMLKSNPKHKRDKDIIYQRAKETKERIDILKELQKRLEGKK